MQPHAVYTLPLLPPQCCPPSAWFGGQRLVAHGVCTTSFTHPRQHTSPRPFSRPSPHPLRRSSSSLSSFCIFSTHGGVLYQHAETLSSAHATKVVASGRACIHGMPHTCASRQHPKREVRWSQKRIYIVMPELPKELDGHPPSPSRLVEHTHGMHMYMCLLLLLDLSSMSSCMHCHEGRTSKFHRRPVQSPPPPQLDVPPN